MMRNFNCVIAILFAGAIARAEELTPQVLQKLKAATVYVDAGGGTGSGVLFKKNAGTGWILTCEHVVAGRTSVRLTFWPGTAQEKTLNAKVTGADPYWDLACCVVENAKDLPEPLALGTRTEIAEGAGAFVAGFPFGAGLAMGKKAPEITITVAKVSAIRRDEEGSVGLVQLEGEVNPGNSGGPVVDARGKVIGIAAAKLMGTQTAFAVPGESTKQFLLGTALAIDFRRGAQTATNVKYDVNVTLADPLGSMKSAGIAYGRRGRVEETTEPKASGAWKKASALMKESILKIDDKTGRATGTIELSRTASDPPAELMVYQVYWTQADGTKVWSEPDLTSAEFQRSPSDGKGPPRTRLESTMKLPAVDLPGLPAISPAAKLELGAVVSDLFLSPDGRRLFALDLGRGRALRISTDPLAIESTLDIGDGAAAMALSPDGKTLVVVLRRATLGEKDTATVAIGARVIAIDPESFKIVSTFDAPIDPIDAAVNNFGALYLTGNMGVVLADVPGKVAVLTWALPKNSFARFHPDQARLYLGEFENTGSSQRCLPPTLRLDGKRSDFEGPRPGDFPMGGDFEISPDGSKLVTMYGGVVRLSRARVLDMMPETTIVPWTAFAFAGASGASFGASPDGTLRSYSAKEFKTRKTWNLGLGINRLVAHPGGKALYAIASPLPRNDQAEEAGRRVRDRNFPHGDLVVIPIPE